MSIEDLRNLYWRQLEGRVEGIVGELTRVRYSAQQARQAWHPSINAYRCPGCILVVAELAGVERSHITVTVEPRRVWLRGKRVPPEPREIEGPAIQVLAMEIDHGAFERDIVLPVEVDPDQVKAEHREGFLRICLPLATTP